MRFPVPCAPGGVTLSHSIALTPPGLWCFAAGALRKLNPRLLDRDIQEAVNSAAFLRRQQGGGRDVGRRGGGGGGRRGGGGGRQKTRDQVSAVDPRHAVMGAKLQAAAPDITSTELLYCLEQASSLRQVQKRPFIATAFAVRRWHRKAFLSKRGRFLAQRGATNEELILKDVALMLVKQRVRPGGGYKLPTPVRDRPPAPAPARPAPEAARAKRDALAAELAAAEAAMAEADAAAAAAAAASGSEPEAGEERLEAQRRAGVESQRQLAAELQPTEVIRAI